MVALILPHEELGEALLRTGLSMDHEGGVESHKVGEGIAGSETSMRSECSRTGESL